MSYSFKISQGFGAMAALILISSLYSCKEEKIRPVTMGLAVVSIEHEVDGQSLAFETAWYENEAGNIYNISRLEYFISAIKLRYNGDDDLAFSKIVYVNARHSTGNALLLDSIPQGMYKGITFVIGLLPPQNCSACLPATIENINMAWPGGMGGGYHFLKLEGSFKDGSSNSNPGYAMHLGTDAGITEIIHDKALEIKPGTNEFTLRMNINEWFRRPATYDFNIDGNYSMGKADQMRKLADNGADVFTFE